VLVALVVELSDHPATNVPKSGSVRNTRDVAFPVFLSFRVAISLREMKAAAEQEFPSAEFTVPTVDISRIANTGPSPW
jgi:hypothetical protein